MPFKERNFYKIVGPDGYDLRTHTIDYLDAIGYTVYMLPDASDANKDWREVCTKYVLHASPSLNEAHYIMSGNAHFERAYFKRIIEVYGTPVCRDRSSSKYGFREFDILREVSDEQEILELLLTHTWRRMRFGRWETTRLSVSQCEAIYTMYYRPRDPFGNKA